MSISNRKTDDLCDNHDGSCCAETSGWTVFAVVSQEDASKLNGEERLWPIYALFIIARKN